MSKKIVSAVITLGFIAGALVMVPAVPVQAQNGTIEIAANSVAGAKKLIVGYSDENSADNAEKELPRVLDEVVDVEDIGSNAVAVELSDSVESGEIAELLADPAVEYVEEDHPVYLAETVWDPGTENLFNWAIRGQEKERDTSVAVGGSRALNTWQRGNTGSRDVYVAVLDTGIDLGHPELVDQLWVNEQEVAGNGIDDDGNGYVDDVNGWSPITSNSNVSAANTSESHSTAVSSILGAKGGNGIDGAGVNWDVGIVPIRLFAPFTSTTNSMIAAGINYAISLKQDKGVNIVAMNMSFGGGGYSRALEDSVRAAGDADILLVAAAGNSSRNTDVTPFYPASSNCVTPTRSWDCMISVAAHNSSGNLADFSNWGVSSVDISAPGENVFVSTPYAEGLSLMSGTSMSAPFVAGAIALCSSVNRSLSAQEIRELLMSSFRQTGRLDGKVANGGQLDIVAFIELCKDPGGIAVGVEWSHLTGGAAIRANGWAVSSSAPAVTANDLNFVVDGVDTQPISVQSTPDGPNRTAFSADVPVATGGVRTVCIKDAGGAPSECYTIYVPPQTSPFGEAVMLPKPDGFWQLTGWALDPADTNSWKSNYWDFDRPVVSLYVDGQLKGSSETNQTGDLSFFPAETYVGWDIRSRDFVFGWESSAGRHTACVRVTSLDGSQTEEIGCFDYVQAAGDNPIGEFENVVKLSNSEARVSGWALDPNVDGVTDLHVFVNNRMVKVGQTGGERPDVAGLYPGYQTGAGYGFTVPINSSVSNNQICVWAINRGAGTANKLLGCKTVIVTGGNPIGNLESVRQDGPGQIRIGGWVHDPDTPNPVKAHVYVNGWFKGEITADGARPDVKRAFGTAGDNHGFNTTVGIRGTGSYNVCVFAINTGIGTTNPLLGCRTVNVRAGNPFGAFDAGRQEGPGTVRVSGWSIDPDTTDAVQLHVYVNGRFHSVKTADASRVDVGRAFRGYGDNHGYDFTLNGLLGGSNVCVFAINAGRGTTNPLLGCRTVNVRWGNPFGAFDVLRASGGNSARVAGWALDPDTTDPALVHVYANGVFVGQFTADSRRTDVGRAFRGYGDNHGYDFTLNGLRSGRNNVCVFAINTGFGSTNPLLGCRTISL